MTSDLPPGWIEIRVAELAEVKYGKALRKVDRAENGPFGVYGSAGLVGYHNVALIEEPVVIVGRKGNAGSVWVAEKPSWPIDTTYFLRVPASVSARFLGYQLENLKLGVRDSSTTIPSLRRPDLEEVPVRLPSRVEQDRIVAAIEEHFSRLDAAERALAAAHRRLDALSRVVVGESCRGSWDTVPLVEIVTSLRNGVFVSRPAPEPPGRPIYRISAVRPLRLRVNDVRYANPEPEGADGYAVDSGDLLFTRYSGNPSYVGAAAVVPEAGRGVLHPDKLIRVVADTGRVLPEWIAAYVSVGEGRRQVDQRLKTTAGQVGISGRQLKSVPIAVPPLDYQRSAVARIGTVMADQDRIEQQLATLRAKSSALRRSILTSAFTGRLVPHIPGDESRSDLVESGYRSAAL